MVYADVLQCTLSYGSSLDPYCHMAEKTGLSKSEGPAGNPVDIRCGSGDPAFISSASYNRVWYESGNSGTIYYDQQSSCKYRTLTGLYNHLYLVRKSNELISAAKSFHIITVYLYQLRHINKIAGVQGGNLILKLTARKLGEMCGKKAFRTTGKRFMILTGSLEEYEYYLTQLKRMFDGNSKLNVNNKIITVPVIISGIMNAAETWRQWAYFWNMQNIWKLYLRKVV